VPALVVSDLVTEWLNNTNAVGATGGCESLFEALSSESEYRVGVVEEGSN